MADIFVSYSSSDRDWAFWIGHQLRMFGHTPHLHDWEVSGGDDIPAWMEKTHNAADHILCVISAAYLKAPYSSWERRAAQWAAAKDRPRFAMPVFIEACEAPTLLAHIKRCDLHDLTEEEARAHLKTFVDPAVPSPPSAFPGRAKASSAENAAQLEARFPGKAPSPNASQTAPKAEPTKQRVSPTALIVDGLKQRARTRANVFLVFEIALFSAAGVLLITTVFAPIASVDAKAIGGLAGACLTGVGVNLWGLHTNAIGSAKLWSVFAEAYRAPGVTLRELNQYDEIVFEHLRREK